VLWLGCCAWNMLDWDDDVTTHATCALGDTFFLLLTQTFKFSALQLGRRAHVDTQGARSAADFLAVLTVRLSRFSTTFFARTLHCTAVVVVVVVVVARPPFAPRSDKPVVLTRVISS